jgi:hypothetical protein
MLAITAEGRKKNYRATIITMTISAVTKTINPN